MFEDLRKCYRVQAPSTCSTIGQWILERGVLIREPADWEDGRLVPQNNHLIGVWMPGSFIDQRERSNEELKTKGRRERERQRGSKVKASSVLRDIAKGMTSLWKGCVNLFHSQVGRDKPSLLELNKGTSVYSQAEGRCPPGKPLNMIIIIKTSQRNSLQHGVRIGFLPATDYAKVWLYGSQQTVENS